MWGDASKAGGPSSPSKASNSIFATAPQFSVALFCCGGSFAVGCLRGRRRGSCHGERCLGKHCCSRFLEEEAFEKLKVDLASDERLLIRTTAFVEELRKRMYTKVILMDHVDWLEQDDIDVLCAALRDQVKPGGRVIWRSASRSPKYAECIAKAGFDVVRITTSDKYMDRVNMYAVKVVPAGRLRPSLRGRTLRLAGAKLRVCLDCNPTSRPLDGVRSWSIAEHYSALRTCWQVSFHLPQRLSNTNISSRCSDFGLGETCAVGSLRGR